MKSTWWLVAVAILVAAPLALAVDRDVDGVDDAIPSNAVDRGNREGETIAVVMIADVWDLVLRDRLADMGYMPALIATDSPFAVLAQYDLVCLPLGHGDLDQYATLTALANDYHQYVAQGGGLWIQQPNPWQVPGQTIDVAWAPYDLTVNAWYDEDDCPAIITADHCLSAGLGANDMPFPADTAVSYSPAWEVVAVGAVTGRPSVMFAMYGEGNVLVEFGHPALDGLCWASAACLENFVACTAGGVVATEITSWGDVKKLFR